MKLSGMGESQALFDLSAFMRPLGEELAHNLTRDILRASGFTTANLVPLGSVFDGYLKSIVTVPKVTAHVLPAFDLTSAFSGHFDGIIDNVLADALAPLRQRWAEMFASAEVVAAFGQTTAEGRLRTSLVAARYLPDDLADARQAIPPAAKLVTEQAEATYDERPTARSRTRTERRQDLIEMALVGVAVQLIGTAATAGVELWLAERNQPQVVVEKHITNIYVDVTDAARREIEAGQLDVSSLLGCDPPVGGADERPDDLDSHQ